VVQRDLMRQLSHSQLWIKKDTKIEFLWAYTRTSNESGDVECVISIDEMSWLKVRIYGIEGFVRDAEDLLALGIHPAG